MDLNELRNQIDGIDGEILKLFSRRMEVCKEVAEYKKANNLPVMQGGREKQVIENIRNKAPEGLEDGAAMLFQNIMDISKCIQNKEMKYTSRLTSPKPFIPENAVKIACQGTAGAYSEAACKKVFGDDYYLIRVEITHCLAAVNGTKAEDIKYVYSKAEALSQCSEFIKKSGFIRREYANTALSAELVSNRNDSSIACICSQNCAGLYGLEIINDRIADAYPNYTRFICFSRDYIVPEDADTISVCLSLSNTPGSLYRLLTKFSVYGLNMTKIESKLIAGSDFEALFYLDFKGSCTDPTVVALLHDLENELSFFRFLGSFKEIL